MIYVFLEELWSFVFFYICSLSVTEIQSPVVREYPVQTDKENKPRPCRPYFHMIRNNFQNIYSVTRRTFVPNYFQFSKAASKKNISYKETYLKNKRP